MRILGFFPWLIGRSSGFPDQSRREPGVTEQLWRLPPEGGQITVVVDGEPRTYFAKKVGHMVIHKAKGT